ncbi:TM2 domain-containing protein [Cellulomonas alba]|uniref:TM2 domain-containing protein n=1 Tax=Cellulomonas alba TaxID=3053467 RepID=A0ABT7SHW1_9CELL|nr:TM2 domain-containing protein [Cellulomonas alba]MDM7855774.1 TM2 domain-containing protein [Cellulomonas alba]
MSGTGDGSPDWGRANPPDAPLADAGPSRGYPAPPSRQPASAAIPHYPGRIRESEKSFVVTWLLAWLLGGFGIDRFYLGKTFSAVLKLVTFGGLGIWWLVDLVLVLVGAQRDVHGNQLRGYERYRVLAWVVTVLVTVAGWALQPSDGAGRDLIEGAPAGGGVVSLVAGAVAGSLAR